MKEAMIAKNTAKSGVLRMLLSAVKNSELEKRGRLAKDNIQGNLDEMSVLTEDEVLAVVAREVKKVKDSIEQFSQGRREDLVRQSKEELEILEVYMPVQMSEDNIRKVVSETLPELNIKNVKEMGKVIGAVMSKVKGQADGKTISKIVKEELGKQ